MPTTVDEYLSKLPPQHRATLQTVRERLHRLLPRANECISYQLPALRQDDRIVLWFGAAKAHCALYPGAHAIAALSDELEGYPTSKGTVRFPVDAPLPMGLLRALVKARLEAPTARQRKAAPKAKKALGRASASRARTQR